MLHETARDPNLPPPSAKPSAVNVNVYAQRAAGVFVDMGGGSSYSFADDKLVGKQLNMFRIKPTPCPAKESPSSNFLTGLPDDKFYDFTFEISADDYRTMLIRTAIRNGVTLPPGAEKLADLTHRHPRRRHGIRRTPLNPAAPQDVMASSTKRTRPPSDN